MNEPRHSHHQKSANESDGLEQLIARHLNELPELQAPQTLIPRVLAALHETETVWWRRPWFNWPVPMRIASMMGLLILSVSTIAAGQWLWTELSAMSTPPELANWFGWLSGTGVLLETLTNALAVIVRSLDRAWIIGGAGVALAAYLACVGLGTACARIVLHLTQFNSESK